MNADEILQEIASQVSVCQRCTLHHTRKRSVPGEGPANAEVMLIGEGPGFHENEQGRPFVGAAGKFLDELLQKAGMSRPAVFIANVVKCRPPNNRDPMPDELLACGEYLNRQIEAINPRVIVTLGRFSMARFLPGARISDIHGQARMVGGRLVVAMYHPAAALHQPALKSVVEADFARLPALMAQAGQKAHATAQPAQPAQPVQPTPPVVEQKPSQPAATPVSLFDLLAQPEDGQGASPVQADSGTPAQPDDESGPPVQLSLF